jgi:hypothetical protein
MSRLQETFRVLKERNERAFIPFVTCGDPDMETTRFAAGLREAGADIVKSAFRLPIRWPMGRRFSAPANALWPVVPRWKMR